MTYVFPLLSQAPIEPAVGLVALGGQNREIEVVPLLLAAAVGGLEAVGGVWVEQLLRLQVWEEGGPVGELDKFIAAPVYCVSDVLF